MIASLKPDEVAYFQQRLQERERQLRAELSAGEERASAEPFAQVAGEAPDRGDESFANLVKDGVNAERQRDTDELREVQDALARIDAGTYGVCLRCGQPISRRRLEASPTARYDVEHQAEQERRGAPSTPTL